MSVKYTCRNCGNVWHGSAVGRVAKGTFSLLGIIAVAASGRGSYMDMAKARDDWKRCPYCGVPGNYNAEYVTNEEPEQQRNPKPKQIKQNPKQIEPSPKQKETERKLKIFYNVLAVVLIFIISAVILTAATCKKEGTEKTKAAFTDARDGK